MPMPIEVIWSKAALDITCRPYLVGSALSKLSLCASEDFFRATDKASLGERPVSLEILNGGKYYFIADAYERVAKKTCQVASLRAKRRLDPADQQWKVEIWDEMLDPVRDATCVVIGDTVATGTTLVGVLHHLLQYMEMCGNVVDVHVFTIAGSYACEPGLQEFSERLEKAGKQLRLVYCNCKFQLADNGTDLKFEAARDMVPEASQGLREALPEGFQHRMKCAVWDWGMAGLHESRNDLSTLAHGGDRFTKPKQHLEEVTEYFHSIGGVPRWLQDGLDFSQAQMQEEEEQAAALKREPSSGARTSFSRKESIW